MMEHCERCGGKIVRCKDAELCACGTFGARRALAVPDRQEQQTTVVQAGWMDARDWASELAEELF